LNKLVIQTLYISTNHALQCSMLGDQYHVYHTVLCRLCQETTFCYCRNSCMWMLLWIWSGRHYQDGLHKVPTLLHRERWDLPDHIQNTIQYSVSILGFFGCGSWTVHV